MTDNKLVSIIIPTYNRAHLIEETLKSIIAQTHTRWECLVIDDGSTDNTQAIVQTICERDDRISYHLRPDSVKAGGNGARNYGFMESNGCYIQWFDDDDIMLPDFLKSKLEAFTEEVELVLCEANVFGDTDVKPKPFKIKCKTDLFKDYVFWKSDIITDTVMFRREFLNDKMLFDPNVTRGQEADFFSRMFFKIQDSQWAVVKEPLFKYRIHAGSKSSLDTDYVKPFKASQSKIAYENLSRAVELGDRDLIQYCYRLLTNYFFRAIEHQHLDLAKTIFAQLLPVLKRLNTFLWLQWLVLGNLFVALKRGFYKVEMYLKTYPIFKTTIAQE